MTKAIKFYALLLLATVTMFGCSEYDDSELRNNVSDLQSRVDKLEKWCETTNTQISALQGVVTALEAKDFVTGVTPITEGSVTVGYTITFSQSNAVTIKNGTNGKDGVNGTAPVIGVAKHTDGLYYWTVKAGAADATWMLDAEGKMIRTTGDKGADGNIGVDGKTPVLSVAADTDGKVYWKVNGEWLMSDGKKVQATGDKGETGAAGSAGSAGEAGKDGDSIFMKDGIDLTDPNNVTLTLADGTTKITFPRTGAVKIFDKFDNFKIGALDAATSLELALNIKDADYKAIKAELTSSAGLTTAIKTRAAGTPWEVAITAPTFKADGTIDAQPVVSITVPTGTTEGDIAMLKVTVIDSKGDEHASTRVLFYSTKVDVESVSIDETLAIVVNKEKTLTVTVLPAEAIQTVTWTSSNEAIATVSADGKVKGIGEGEATITATATDGSNKTGTCKVTVTKEKTIAWATGNLVADEVNGGCKIGTPTDNGLFFQFGSLVGWSETGDPTVVLSPVGYTGSTMWDRTWTGDPATENAATGTGDPCKHYLKETWRLPTKDEYATLFNNVTDGSYANSGGWSWDETNKFATNSTKSLTFPASGYRYYGDGTLEEFGIVGQYWSPLLDSDLGDILFFTSSYVKLSTRIWRSFGLPVRCVQEK